MNWKRWALGLVVGVLGLLAIPVLAIGPAFMGNEHLTDGQQVGPLTTVVDGYVAMYLGEAPDGSLYLFDAGNDPTGAAMDQALAKRGKTAADVKALFITHGHTDHLQGCARLPNAEVIALAPAVPVIQGTEATKGPLPRWMKTDGACHVDRSVTDGEVVDIGGAAITAFAVPGHTVGSAVYLVDGVLVFGDAASSKADGHLVGPPWVFTDDGAQAGASLQALAKRVPSEVKWMVFGHTGPQQGSGPLRDFR